MAERRRVRWEGRPARWRKEQKRRAEERGGVEGRGEKGRAEERDRAEERRGD